MFVFSLICTPFRDAESYSEKFLAPGRRFLRTSPETGGPPTRHTRRIAGVVPIRGSGDVLCTYTHYRVLRFWTDGVAIPEKGNTLPAMKSLAVRKLVIRGHWPDRRGPGGRRNQYRSASASPRGRERRERYATTPKRPQDALSELVRAKAQEGRSSRYACVWRDRRPCSDVRLWSRSRSRGRRRDRRAHVSRCRGRRRARAERESAQDLCPDANVRSVAIEALRSSPYDRPWCAPPTRKPEGQLGRTGTKRLWRWITGIYIMTNCPRRSLQRSLFRSNRWSRFRNRPPVKAFSEQLHIARRPKSKIDPLPPEATASC